MQMEGAFGATKGMSTLYGGFFKDVAREVGTERALALHAQRGKPFGEMLVGMLRAQVADKELDIPTLSSVASAAQAVFGITPDVTATATSLKVCTHQCPIYDGWKEAGLDHEAVAAGCRAVAAVEYAELTKAFPQLSVRLEFRSAPDGTCVEEYALAK
jgi:hypothetical protein